MGCKAQTTVIAVAIARICNAADRPEPGMRRAREACSALPLSTFQPGDNTHAVHPPFRSDRRRPRRCGQPAGQPCVCAGQAQDRAHHEVAGQRVLPHHGRRRQGAPEGPCQGIHAGGQRHQERDRHGSADQDDRTSHGAEGQRHRAGPGRLQGAGARGQGGHRQRHSRGQHRQPARCRRAEGKEHHRALRGPRQPRRRQAGGRPPGQDAEGR